MIEFHKHNGVDSPRIDGTDLTGPIFLAADIATGVSALRTTQPSIIQRGFYTLGAGTDIALDVATSYASTTSAAPTLHQWTHTVTGSNTALVVGVNAQPSAMSYNGVAMTKIVNDANNKTSLWGLIAPATGGNTVQASMAAGTSISAVSISYTGANQSSIPDLNSKRTQTGGTQFTASVGSQADRDWGIMAVQNNDSNGANWTSDSNTVIRGSWGTTSNDGIFAVTDTGTLQTPPGAITQQVGWVSAVAATIWNSSMISLAPVGANTFVSFPQAYSETTTLHVFLTSNTASKAYLQGIVTSGFSVTGTAADTGQWVSIGYK